MPTTCSAATRASTASSFMPTAALVTVADVSLKTEQATSALAAAASHSAADASAIASADATVIPTVPEDVSHPDAAMLVRVSQVDGCFSMSSFIC